MIISEQKPRDEILQMLKRTEKLFIIGCDKCAAKLRVGGEPEVKEMADSLRASGLDVLGGCVAGTGCSEDSLNDTLSSEGGIDSCDAVLMLACGSGTALASRMLDKPVYPGLNTLSEGALASDQILEGQCQACGDCDIWVYGGICPTSQCAKGLLNGPCGGSNNGKCEVDDSIECAWEQIYKRLEQLDMLDNLSAIKEAKDHSRRVSVQADASD